MGLTQQVITACLASVLTSTSVVASSAEPNVASEKKPMARITVYSSKPVSQPVNVGALFRLANALCDVPNSSAFGSVIGVGGNWTLWPGDSTTPMPKAGTVTLYANGTGNCRADFDMSTPAPTRGKKGNEDVGGLGPARGPGAEFKRSGASEFCVCGYNTRTTCDGGCYTHYISDCFDENGTYCGYDDQVTGDRCCDSPLRALSSAPAGPGPTKVEKSAGTSDIIERELTPDTGEYMKTPCWKTERYCTKWLPDGKCKLWDSRQVQIPC